MSRKYFNQTENMDSEGESSSEDDWSFLFVICSVVAGGFAIAGLIATAKMGADLSKDKMRYESAASTQGVLIERIKIPNERHPPEYYLRYKFENPDGV